ncbi:hypothetical protein VMT65_31415 [Nocardia sp. CDC153]|uniref:hypothetical protein n=1 Tax=Nocardia sp. CDC153 TaxID=3112167 RepID=UPI002DBE3D73|nr:hypothetical protein [Nocardia sp. CDC153]MEC3957579.1 hypothetical protein [Nocardia sp. CDC153]
MAVLLAFGVVADRNRRAWLVETGEEIDHDGPEGAAVVLGDRDSDPARVAIACADLAGLIEHGGTVIAGAGIDLGEGFVSARLAGASGDRRDAVLAALRVLKLGGAWRLGERTATLVALFGVTATKPVGAAAEQAIGEGRWAAVLLASAAAELLGPEQLVRVLELRSPEGVDPMPEVVPSVLAANLRQVLERYSRPRRLELVLDLWRRVCAWQVGELARDRLIASHDLTVLDALRARYREYDEAEIVKLVQNSNAGPLTMVAAIRFRPTWRTLWKPSVERLIQDAVSATVLLRAAVAVHELGVVAGLARVREEIATVSALYTKNELERAQRGDAQSDSSGLLPARPGVHVREIDARLRQQAQGAAFERFVRTRLRTALAYALIVADRCRTLLGQEIPREVLPEAWDSEALREWRAVAGHTARIAPTDWHYEPLVRRGRPSLADRLAADAAAVERASDLVWIAELADAMARARGHAAAVAEGYYRVPEFDTDPARPQPHPLTPRAESIPLAVAGAAQLLALGAIAPQRCRDWDELCGALMGSGAVAAALSSEFEVDESVLARDGEVLPGTTLRVQIARNAAHLAEWSDYMGNCIAGPWYQDQAVRGLSILVAVRDESGVIAANAELRRVAGGYAMSEIAGRFNNQPDAALRQAFRVWVETLRGAEPEAEPAELDTVAPPARARRGTHNPVRDLEPVLREAARKAMVDSEPALRTLVALAGDTDGDPKTLTALRRSTADRLTRLCADHLDAHPAALPRLWTATGTRPLAAALDALAPTLLDRYPRLRTLPTDAPLPSKVLRALVKDPDIATARSMDLVAQRVRAAFGRLARRGDRSFTHALAQHPTADLLCPLILMTTCAPTHAVPVVSISDPHAITVPGFPVTDLSDHHGPWQSAWPAAHELGLLDTDREVFWTRIATHGLLVPAAWLGSGGWPTLWSRAHTK